MPDEHEPRIERGGEPGSYYFYRPNQVLIRDGTSGEAREQARTLFGPEVSSEPGDVRAVQRESKRKLRSAPFGYSLYSFDATKSAGGRPMSAVDAVDALNAKGVSAHLNYVSSRTPMRSHAVSYAEPAELDADVPPLQPAAEGADRLLVGVLDTGRPHYQQEFLEYYKHRYGLSLNRPVGELDDIFSEHPQPAHAGEPAADQDTMIAPFGRLTHPHAGHGMFVSSIIARQAPGVAIVAQATMYKDGIADLFEILVDLEDADAEGCRLLNMSLGFRSKGDVCPEPLDEAISTLDERGVLLVTSAGNDGNGREMWPAAHGKVVAVAATDGNGTPTDWSNFGKWIDACAFGDDVVSNYVFADWDFPDGTAKRFRGAAKWSGTSFAAPLVTGLIAKRMLTNRSLSSRAAWEKLKGTGTAKDATGRPIPEVYGKRIIP